MSCCPNWELLCWAALVPPLRPGTRRDFLLLASRNGRITAGYELQTWIHIALDWIEELHLGRGTRRGCGPGKVQFPMRLLAQIMDTDSLLEKLWVWIPQKARQGYSTMTTELNWSLQEWSLRNYFWQPHQGLFSGDSDQLWSALTLVPAALSDSPLLGPSSMGQRSLVDHYSCPSLHPPDLDDQSCLLPLLPVLQRVRATFGKHNRSQAVLFKILRDRTSLAVQWLRICFPM